jgi:hypothetical protein
MINSSAEKAVSGDKTPGMQELVYEMESYLRITDCDAMRPFFMSIVSEADLWMFISSNGGITAGRKNPEYALFPYYTDDKITDSADFTGSKTLFQVSRGGRTQVWEPFSERFTGKYNISRNLAKNVYGNKILFEEVNHDLELIFRFQWSSSKKFGFVKKSVLVNASDAGRTVTLLDGIQNIMPYGVPSSLQATTSNLVDAYKRSELEPQSGMGIFSLSAIIVDKAEPSEALKASIAWSLGLERPVRLLSSQQLDRFRRNGKVTGEADVKGEKGAYFVSSEIMLPPHGEKQWKIVADVNRNHTQIIDLCHMIREEGNLDALVQQDIDAGTQKLLQLVASADGLQCTADNLRNTRHYANVLFNILRGGVFADQYRIRNSDFAGYLAKANKVVAARHREVIETLEDRVSLFSLKDLILRTGDADLIRLSTEYLPLKFSRRHGDPSRPWNYFSIHIQDETDGSEILNYEGNWRDLFQNWEALAHSCPVFIEGMIFKFLNASTFDGYNPYRVTKDGFDWETIEPDNPWSYIGYWGDHQVIYLQKFLEISEKFYSGSLQALFDKEWFVYAAVPYLIKPYEEILRNPKSTIAFDHHWDAAIRSRRNTLGADGALLTTPSGVIHHVNFIEKILATVLAKISNFIPGAGIWMNTQRPEWNDANNALVGNGVSMVTLCYLHRFMKFFRSLLDGTDAGAFQLSEELAECYHEVWKALREFSPYLSRNFNDVERKKLLDLLGRAGSVYRQKIYRQGFQGGKTSVTLAGLKEFTGVCLRFIEHTIRSNRREDKLYHAYNLMTATGSEISVSHLGEMLEGQVAVLSASHLSSAEALEVLDAMKESALFREDQYSYLLYPNRELPGFLKKNLIPASEVASSELIGKLITDGNRQIIDMDRRGGLHFNGNFRNAGDLHHALDTLAECGYCELVAKERRLLGNIFENVFNHKTFTGRSGTFYGYEGLGSIYWHMVSKLLLAVQECCLQAFAEKADHAVTVRLLDHYYEIEAGIGVHKSPALYGAFPTEPYSHTPAHRGAQQPGMTGQVKEDILSRFGELGVFVREQQICFCPRLLRKEEFLSKSMSFEYVGTDGKKGLISLNKGELAFTFCQVPVVYASAGPENIVVHYVGGSTETVTGHTLSPQISSLIFQRTGRVEQLRVFVNTKG